MTFLNPLRQIPSDEGNIRIREERGNFRIYEQNFFNLISHNLYYLNYKVKDFFWKCRHFANFGAKLGVLDMQKKENRAMRRRVAGAWISSVISIALVLLLVGIGAMLLVNARSVSDWFKENVRISAIMKDEVDEPEANLYRLDLEKLPFVKETRLITRDEGIEELSRMLGPDFIQVFETSPVPVSIDITLDAAYVHPDSLKKITARLEGSPLVGETVCQTSVVETLTRNLTKISAVLGTLILLLLFISYVLIGNMVRINVFNRRFTIHTMQMTGATRSYIRAPFLWGSAFQGLFASLLAIMMLLGGLFVLRSEFAALFEVFSLDLLLKVMAIVMVSGVLICTVTTYFVVNRLVGFSKDELYAY